MTVVLFPPRPSLTVIYGRLMTCTTCGHDVDVIEIPNEWLDPEAYVCGHCLAPIREAEAVL